MFINDIEIQSIIEILRNKNNENGWIEVKENYLNIDKMGETISAIANQCLLEDHEYGYIILGIQDRTWKSIGIKSKLLDIKVGNQEGKLYLSTLLKPIIDFEFFDDLIFEDKILSVIKIQASTHTPIQFKKEIYIRIGSNNKLAKDFPEVLKKLYNKISGYNYEEKIIKNSIKKHELEKFLSISTYLDVNRNINPFLINSELDINIIIEEMVKDDLIEIINDHINIKTLGALLYARKLEYFKLEKKGIRLVFYDGKTKSSIKEQFRGEMGYIVGFSNLMKLIKFKLPKTTVFIDDVQRKTVEIYPQIIIRELLANAIVHQDLNNFNSSIRLEIFENRIEITNPGKSLVSPLYLFKEQKSRNPKLAYLMTKANLCEELGSGIDRVVETCEKGNYITPIFKNLEDSFNVTMFTFKNFDNMTDIDKINTLFYHCCYKNSIGEYMSNSSLRERFRLPSDKAYVDKITRLINKAKKNLLIKEIKKSSYIPIWA